MKTSIKAVIFDLDGTITEPWFDFDVVREQMGLERNSGPVLEAMMAMTEQQRQEAEKVLYRYESQAIAESRLNPGARETLATLREKNIKIGILTRNKRENAVAIADRHNLQFDAVLGRDDGPAKPDAFGVRRLCEQFGVETAETMMVGDYLFDIQCGKAAGAVAVLLANQENWEEFARYADHTVDRIDEILGIIAGDDKHTAGSEQV